jgi:hypothetical protein
MFDQSQFVRYQLQACFGLFFSSLWLFFWVRAPQNTTGPLNLHPRIRLEPNTLSKHARGVARNARDLWRAVASNAYPALHNSGYCQQRTSNKRLLILALVSLCCGSCALPGPGQYAPFGPNDHAFMSAQPYPREVALAKKRFQNFLRHANNTQRLTLAQTPYVAVRAYTLTTDEVPGLNWRMALGKIPMLDGYGGDLLYNSGSVPVQFLLIFDQRTGELAAPDGVLVVGNPTKGKIAKYGGLLAIYAGGGSW